jgi:2-C-methyl-D-erythritol 4-phosphate cytidylyltransferase/2-C-methyl-D-erythritol 2,4-cyclodiphosphate synthase
MTDSTDASSEKIAPPVAVILLAGGKGQRAGFEQPKQYQMLGGQMVLAWSVAAFNAHPATCAHVLVADEDVRALLGDALAGWAVTSSGAERQQSVANALAQLSHLPDDNLVLVHDAARPGVSHAVIDRLIAAVAAGDNIAAIPTLPVPDTLVTQDAANVGDVVDRSAIARVQTPQAFRLGHLRAAHTAAAHSAATDDAQLVRTSGVNIVAVAGDARLHKLTFAEDLTILNALLQTETPMRTAVGMGYDVHKLVPDRPLWIGGITIDHTHGLLGHSDADVALHALTDAILGALADGDIGDHFPPTDPKWSGAASDRFLEFAGQRVMERGGSIQHLDLTIIAEAPKIGPHRIAIRQRISEILNLPLDYVSVKATTSEKLGFTGRREGIAAQAVATLKLPEA